MRIESEFEPAWWLNNRHVQSMFASFFPYRAKTKIRWEELRYPDGDFTDIVWAGDPDDPVVVLLHGLEGSFNSHYIQIMIDTLVRDGWQVVVMHYRTCSGRLNRLPQAYNGGDVKDIEYLIEVIAERYPDREINLVGFSLGGSLIIHYLSKHSDAPVHAAVAVSTPYELDKSSLYLMTVYHQVLLRSLRKKTKEKIRAGIEMPVTAQDLRQMRSLRDFDRAVTAPLYGYDSLEEYYHDVSVRPMLKHVKHPLLIIHAMDDPFIPPETVPADSELAEKTILEISPSGGHVGFIAGGFARPKYWLQDRIHQFLREDTAQVE